MASLLRRWLLARVVKSALVLETKAIETYGALRVRPGKGAMKSGLQHLLEEEEIHRRILNDAAAGRLDPESLEKALREHPYSNLASIRPLDEEALEEWGDVLGKALASEKETFIFYGNLRRMSKIPAVKRAFEVLADMEREHVGILSKLLGELQAPSPY
jgi:rubrerythrin